ncbi:NAD(P) transhydrogenase subunit alpha [Monoraphidium neglectum]|uniref:proton-translocating NAD(P)(+) transhydrogenase n=1 Tax=Monoraphidium neglectum TaxID=145388 RepID=A0A0D2KB28_9CHLO|nr:NAD(P) transhydrogenase subunit alpha [Monoraphidium neglectum]KIY93148.1 NAD(P) transhydrogenase subunit alpha [Monoraphidium neglectum]|eukprot:XP_013892168.1 NAD(P) transhydrogenase subunit alpha [Monoraphidium neglectum]
MKLAQSTSARTALSSRHVALAPLRFSGTAPRVSSRRAAPAPRAGPATRALPARAPRAAARSRRSAVSVVSYLTEHAPIAYKDLSIGVPRETAQNEKRVALTPQGVASLLKQGFAEVVVESGAGAAAEFSDAEYVAAGAKIGQTSDAFGRDIVLKVRPPSLDEAKGLKQGARLISYIYPAREKELLATLQARRATVIGARG